MKPRRPRSAKIEKWMHPAASLPELDTEKPKTPEEKAEADRHARFIVDKIGLKIKTLK
jgi:hypothetical protein